MCKDAVLMDTPTLPKEEQVRGTDKMSEDTVMEDAPTIWYDR